MGVGGTSGFLGLYTLGVVAAAVGWLIATWVAVRPLLTALPRSSERMSFTERARMTAASSPWWQLISAGVVCAFAAVWLAPLGFYGLAHEFSIDWVSTAAAWFWAIAFASGGAYRLYLTALKLR
jgi:hypothetical protein